jgi:hypothetical protein
MDHDCLTSFKGLGLGILQAVQPASHRLAGTTGAVGLQAASFLHFRHSPARMQSSYRSGAKYSTTLIIAPANMSVLNNVFAWFIVPLIAVGRF